MKNTWYEIRYLIAAPLTLLLLTQYVALYWLEARIWNPLLYPLAAVFILENFVFQLSSGRFSFWSGRAIYNSLEESSAWTSAATREHHGSSAC